MENQFMSRLMPEVKKLMDQDPSARIPVILTVYGNAGLTSIDLRTEFRDADVIYLTGYVFANFNQSEINTILADFPDVKFISINRRSTHA